MILLWSDLFTMLHTVHSFSLVLCVILESMVTSSSELLLFADCTDLFCHQIEAVHGPSVVGPEQFVVEQANKDVLGMHFLSYAFVPSDMEGESSHVAI